MKNILLTFLYISLFFNLTVYTQTSLSANKNILYKLPDISIISNFYSEISKESKNLLNIKEIELVFQGYLYPQIRSDIIWSLHRHENIFEVELDEGYVSFQTIVGGLGLDFGRKYIDFGKINKIHPHHRGYFDQPEFMKKFFGEHNLVGDGFWLNYNLPFNFFSRITFGIWDIPKFHQHNHDNEDEHNNENFSLSDRGYNSKLWLSFPLSKISELELGLNHLVCKGPDFSYHKDDVNILSLDFTYKHIISAYKVFKVQTEIFHLIRDIPLGIYNRLGGYLFLDYKISKYWALGIRTDYVEEPKVVDEQELEKKEVFSSLSFVITRNITESTYFRTQYKNEQDNNHRLYLQFVFGFGPHSHMLE